MIAILAVGCSERTEVIPAMESDMTNHTNEEIIAKANGKPGVVASFIFTLGRQSRDCKGFGVCEVVFLGIAIIEMPDKPEEKVAEIIASETGDLMGIYLLDEPLELEDDNFYIDTDFTESDEEGNRYMIMSGIYEFNPELGNYGGYQFDVTRL